MKARLVVALVAVLGATAFAPAPFPKPTRRGDAEEISVGTFQGNWRVASMMHSSKDGKHRPYTWHISDVSVEGKTWTFKEKTGQGGTSYTITIDNSKKPAAHLDFWNGEPRPGQRAPGQGIIRRRGQLVEIIYVFGGAQRPVSFAQPPDGQYVLTLQRQ